MAQAFLVKYGEIALKGKNRHTFEEALVRQIEYALRPVEGSFVVTRPMGRIFVECTDHCDAQEVTDALSRVFGILGICPCQLQQDTGFEDLASQIIAYVDQAWTRKDVTFKVFARRARKNYPMDSMELNAAIGERLLNAFPELSVDVHHPQKTLFVEIREKIVFYSEEVKGPGGMPIGTSGSATLLLSGGIDSPVAGYTIARRGVSIDAVYFHAPPYTSERAKQKVVDLAKQLSKYTGPIRLHVVNFTEIQMYIYEACPHDELTIIMRRYMMRIAEHFAAERHTLGLITGESIGQVASQTMQSLLCTNAVCTLPVYRPLIGMDKQDIIDVAERIGTYETSILPYEDCCTIFVAKHPVTRPRLSVIEHSERNLEEKIDGMLQTAIETTEIITVGEE